jgi:hypothetical protein
MLIGGCCLIEYNLTQGSIISYSVEPEKLGLGFGIVYCFMNITLSVIPPILGFIE